MAKGRERSAKFYFDNEKEVMLSLGLTPTPGSGSGWVNKEDGENDHLLCQLKSTDKSSYSLKQLDLQKLEYNATVANKIPLFIVQFLKSNDMYVLCNLSDIPDIAQYLETGEVKQTSKDTLISDLASAKETKPKKKQTPKIKSSISAREAFHKEQQAKYENRKRRY